MSLLSGNTCEATVWSDARRRYPMLPEVSPVQRCPHCSGFYFIDDAGTEYGDDNFENYSFELGTLTFDELKKAKSKLETMSLTKNRRWTLNHMLLMAYNDTYCRGDESAAPAPPEEDRRIFESALAELLAVIDEEPGYGLFHVEFLREAGRFDEAMEVLRCQETATDQWIIDAMEAKIAAKDAMPFLLVDRGMKAV